MAHDGITQTVAEISDSALRAKEKFERLGLKLKNSRFLTYLETLKQFAGADSTDISKAGATEKVGRTLLEVADFVEIAQLDDDFLSDVTIKQKLQNALYGRAFRVDYASDEHDPHRDDALELCAASYLARFKVLGPPPKDKSDVIYQDGAQSVPIECKRIARPQALKGALRQAKRQLRERRKTGRKARV